MFKHIGIALLLSAGLFVTIEAMSLAFWLISQPSDVMVMGGVTILFVLTTTFATLIQRFFSSQKWKTILERVTRP